MGNEREKLTLDRSVTYEICIPGQLDESWLQWNETITMRVKEEGDRSVTTLTCTMDQAALQGLLRRLYAMGMPLLSVVHLQENTRNNMLFCEVESTPSAKPLTGKD